MKYEDYDRVVDTLLYLSDNIVLSFVTVLSSKVNGVRRFLHSETYATNNSIKRSMRFYFSLDDRTSFGDGIILKPGDVQVLIMLLESKVFPWYFSEETIYKIIDNRLNIVGVFEKVDFIQSEYKYLSFVPIVYQFSDDSYKQGIRMYINKESEFVDMDIDKFMNLYSILKNTDMYNAASNALTYAKTGQNGINVWESDVPKRGLGADLSGRREYNNPNLNDNPSTTDSGKNDFLNSI